MGPFEASSLSVAQSRPLAASERALVACWSRIFNLVIFYVADITLCAFDIQEGNPPSTEGNRATNGQSGRQAGGRSVAKRANVGRTGSL